MWRLASKAAGVKAAEEIPHQAPVLSVNEVFRCCAAAATAGDLSLAAVLALTWVTCARTGSIVQLRKEDVAVEGNTISVTFRRGKGVRMRQVAHSVHSDMGEFSQFITPALQEGAGFLFPAKSRAERAAILASILDLLRQETGRVEVKNYSIRRGALQALALAGMPMSKLLHYSGHATEAMLRTYLGFGRHVKADARTAAEHVRALVNRTAAEESC